MAQAAALLDRLVDDEYLLEQLAAGGGRLRNVYRAAPRMRRKPTRGQILYEAVRGAAPAVADALRRVAPEPEPKRPRPGRVLLALLGVGLAAAALYFAWRRDQAQPEGEGGAAAGAPPTTGTPTQ